MLRGPPSYVAEGGTEKNKAKLEANVRSVLEAAENALAMEIAEEPQELSSEEMSKRAERILKKMDEEGISDKKQNHGFKRFKLKSNVKVNVEFGLVALAHNLRKYIAVERMRSNAVSSCL